jgi:hypothetical protein
LEPAVLPPVALGLVSEPEAGPQLRLTCQPPRCLSYERHLGLLFAAAWALLEPFLSMAERAPATACGEARPLELEAGCGSILERRPVARELAGRGGWPARELSRDRGGCMDARLLPTDAIDTEEVRRGFANDG